MSTHRWQTIDRLYHAALERPADARAAFLAEACAGDEALRREVLSLLEQPSMPEFLGTPAVGVAAAMLSDSLVSQWTGRRIGVYQLQALLGKGGMGEVYRARDTRLGRDVAIKVLPRGLTADPDRLARFEREARLLASLNHANIGTIHGLEEGEGIRALVLELVEGETLAERVSRGPLPVAEALTIARQITDALDAAHDKGIVHRDLKPANIKITPDGVVKVLDFGLAKGGTELAARDLTQSPTLAVGGTHEGVILGTAPYMSPEQARGHAVDKRTDIWAFGCVLYELLTGRTAFTGATVSDTIAAILQREPDWTALPATLPSGVTTLLHRCLEKDVKRRKRDIGDARAELDEAIARPVTRDTSETTSLPSQRDDTVKSLPSRRAFFTAAVLTLAAAVGATGWLALRQDKAWTNPLENALFSRLTDFEGSELDAALSPDGKFVTFLADQGGQFDAFIGQVGSGAFSNATKGRFPELFHEQLRSVGFSGDGTEIWLRVSATDPVSTTALGVIRGVWMIPALGGSPRRIFERANAAIWSPDGTKITYFEPLPGDPIFIADRQGINPRQVFASNAGEHSHYESWSPDGRYIYFTRGFRASEMDVWRVPADGGQAEQITRHNSRVAYPTALDNRTLLYTAMAENGAGSWLYAMDLETRVTHRANLGVENLISIAASAGPNGPMTRLVATVANPRGTLWTVPILDRVASDDEAKRLELPAVRAVSPRYGPNYLLYLSSKGGGDGLWKFQDGAATELWKPTDEVLMAPAAVSPDGKRICFVVRKGTRQRLYMMTSDGTGIQPLAESLDVRDAASWSPDGKSIVVSADQGNGGRLFRIPIDGGEPEQLVDELSYNPVWSPDGRLILYYFQPQGALFPLRAITPDRKAFKLPDVSTRGEGGRFRFLPDGRSFVVLLGPFRNQNFYLVNIDTGVRRQLTEFKPGYSLRNFDVSPDGKHIVFDRVQENSDIVLIDLPPR